MLKSEMANDSKQLQTLLTDIRDKNIPISSSVKYVSDEFNQAIVRNIGKLTLTELEGLPKEMRDAIIARIAYAYEFSRDMVCYEKLVEFMLKSDDICLAIVKKVELAAIGTPGGHTLGNLAVGFSEKAKFYVLGSEQLFLRDLARMNTVYNNLLRVNSGKITVPARQ